ncbi:hypothetical protein HA402_001049 [Bradysia odoriphaga]|nr:hypothetical protein HA402_001049 [Bradysia odoriphaga]
MNPLFEKQAQSANILAFVSDHSRSHCIILESLLQALAQRGHNVTIVSMCSAKNRSNALPNYHEIHLNGKNVFLDEYRNDVVSKMKNSNKQAYLNAMKALKINAESSNRALEDPMTKLLLSSGQTFDLFILGWQNNEFLLGIAAHFKCPSIVFYTMGSTKTIRDFVASPASVQNNRATAIVHRQVKSTFTKRLSYMWEHVIEFLLLEFYDYFVFQSYYDQHFPSSGNFPTYQAVKQNVSLVFTCHHFSQGGLRPTVPNLIEVGGIHIKNRPDPLPATIEEFLRNTNDYGAILFSLGTIVNSADFASEKVEAILGVFAGLRQKVIWKWESNDIPRNKPDNVLMTKWVPQDDLLAHSNMRLFISHCGLGGVTEALFHGVPILGIPFIYDQHMNAINIADEGWSIHLPYDSITSESFSSAVNEMLSNQSYTVRVKELSKLYRDRPQTALDTAVYWTEYVIRHRGAAHLQMPQLHRLCVSVYGITAH